jgi:hypothetical protein
MDSDWFTEKQREALKKEMKDIGPTVIWPFYTFESILLTDLNKLSTLILNLSKQQINDTSNNVNQNDLKGTLKTIVNDHFLPSKIYLTQKKMPENMGKVKQWFNTKIKTFEKSDIYKNFCNNTDDHQLNYVTFIQSELDKENYSVIATKEDVQEICRLTLQDFHVTINEEIDIVYELLKLISPATWYNQWDELFDLIYT